MDLRLPVLDGWEATRRSRPRRKYIPVIALTHVMTAAGKAWWDATV
jgi:CheY-like chemotaxis protein